MAACIPVSVPAARTARSARYACLVATLVFTGCSDAATTSTTTSTGLERVGSIDVSHLAPRSSYAIFEIVDDQCSVIDGSNPSAPVPVASVFKLWVLDALAREIERGAISWDDTIAVRNELRSDPSGEVFGYPEGQQVSVKRMAELMISISDNTATDHLIDHIGRAAIEDVVAVLAPDGVEQTLPLLSTADMGRLKFAHPDLGREYVALSAVRRSEFVAGLAERAPLPTDPSELVKLDLLTPSFVDEIEWFASGQDLCRTMADLARLSRMPDLQPIDTILSINSGLPSAQAARWNTTWFKGGSEPGVVALVYRVVSQGVDRVVVVTFSDPSKPLEQSIEGEQIISSILDRASQ